MRRWRLNNPERNAEIKKASHQKNRDEDIAKMRGWHLASKYGLTNSQYREMLERQGGKCRLCGKPPVNNSLAVDHDHHTGRVRGLLCPRCNGALGWYERTGHAAITAYLERQ